MISWAVTFLIIAIIAAVLGFTGIAGAATQIAWIAFVVGIIMAIFFFITGRRPPPSWSRKATFAETIGVHMVGSGAPEITRSMTIVIWAGWGADATKAIKAIFDSTIGIPQLLPKNLLPCVRQT